MKASLREPFATFSGAISQPGQGGLVATAQPNSGAVIRANVTKADPSSTLQARHRAKLSTIAHLWQTLTATQRAAWATAASAWLAHWHNPGRTQILPYSFFCKTMYYRYAAASSPSTTAPTNFICPTFGDNFFSISHDFHSAWIFSATMASKPKEPDQCYAFCTFTDSWTKTARIPRQSDFSSLASDWHKYDYMGNWIITTVKMLERYGGASNLSGANSATNKDWSVGATVWATILPLSSQFVPAPFPTITHAVLS